MAVKVPSPIKTWKGRFKDVLFGSGGIILTEFLPKVGDDEIVHAIDQFKVKHKIEVIRALPVKRRVNIILDISDWSLESVISRLTFDEIWELISVAESDDAADIIQWLYPSMRKRVIEKLKKDGDKHGLLPLLVFDETTAGGRMKLETLRFRVGGTISDIRRMIGSDANARRKSHYVYIVDKDDVLLGRISLLKIVQSSQEMLVEDVMDKEIVALPSTLDQEDVANLFDEHSAIELPVVNHRNKLLGVITADDVFAVMEEEFNEDVSRMAGVHDDAHISDPVWLSVRRRIPWLGLNTITAMLTAVVVMLFEGTIQEVVILAAFMPVISGIGGNVANQAGTITIRAIAVGEIKHLVLIKVIFKEVLVGGINGLLTGTIISVLALLWTGNPILWFVIIVAMTTNLMLAGFIGLTIPLIMRALKTDPALASSVFVTAITDIGGFAILLGLATLLLR